LLDDDCAGLPVLPCDGDDEEVLPEDCEDEVCGKVAGELEVDPEPELELEDEELDDELELELELDDELLDCSDSGGLHAASPSSMIDISATDSVVLSDMAFLAYSSNVYIILTFSVAIGLPASRRGRNGVVEILSLAMRRKRISSSGFEPINSILRTDP
jgi:hypothetical protein